MEVNRRSDYFSKQHDGRPTAGLRGANPDKSNLTHCGWPQKKQASVKDFVSTETNCLSSWLHSTLYRYHQEASKLGEEEKGDHS